MSNQNKNTIPVQSQDPEQLMVTVAHGLARALRTDAVTRGEHTSEYLPRPETSPFGVFDKRVGYVRGCMPLRELSSEEGGSDRTLALAFRMRKPDGRSQLVVIGRTPIEFDPSRGGRLPRDLNTGKPGEYLMIAYPMDGKGDPTSRYMDEAEMVNVRAHNGGDISFQPNPDRQRELVISGQLEETVGLVSTRRLSDFPQ